MKTLVLLLLILSLSSCGNSKQSTDDSKEDKTLTTDTIQNEDILITSSTCDQMDSLLIVMDSLMSADYSADNDELIWQYSSQIEVLALGCSRYLANNGNYSPDNFDLCWSADSVLGILSWDTRMGGTFVNVEHIKFSKNENSAIFYKSTDRVKKGDGDINSTSYWEIAKLPIEGKDIYICHGAGKTSNPTFYYSLDVVEVSNAIKPYNIFPEDRNTISINYDMMEIYGDTKVLDYIVLTNGDIQIPEMKDYSIPSGKYITWNLIDGTYKEKLPYEALIPKGYSIYKKQTADLYEDEDAFDDVVLILSPVSEVNDEYSEDERITMILRGTKDGYKLISQNQHVVMCKECGGAFGDPFDYLELKPKSIEIGHYGGSSQRWYDRFTFQLNNNDKWELFKTVNGGHSVFDEDGDGEIDEYEEMVKTKEDFGTVLFDDFGKE